LCWISDRIVVFCALLCKYDIVGSEGFEIAGNLESSVVRDIRFTSGVIRLIGIILFGVVIPTRTLLMLFYDHLFTLTTINTMITLFII